MARELSFAYDAYGRVTQTTFPSTLTEGYAYDAVGNLTSKTDRKGQTIGYTYDALNRLTQKSYSDSTAVNYTYDAASRLTQVTDPTGTYGFTYDRMGRLTGTSTAYSFLTGRTFTNSYSYDAASNRTGFTDPEGGSTTYAYDMLNRLTGLNGAVGGQFTFGYDALSRRTSLSRPNAVNTAYSYDSVSRLLSVLHQSGGSTIDGATYIYDNAGNRTSKLNQLTAVTENYTYDAIYQLTQVVQGANTTEAYTYDQVGNRMSSLGASPYTYNNSNQLTATPSATFTYDNNGNTASKADSSGTTSYAWDFENRLTSVTLPGSGGTVSFKYDPFGRRIQKVSALGTTVYTYDGANIAEETDGTGAVVARYAQGIAIDEPLAENRAGMTAFYEADGLGSVTSLSAAGGSLANSYVYEAFGRLTASSGTVNNPFRYTGREFDSESGVYYYRARYYDSTIGRFICEDPIQFRSGINLYTYVWNNPVLLNDPSGLDPNKPGLWQRLTDALRECWKDPFGCGGKPGSFGPGPDAAARNMCDSTKGQKYLFGEASPINPYYRKDVASGRTDPDTDLAVAAWKRSFLAKCEARGNTVSICGSSALGPSGPQLICGCCELCEVKKK